MNNGGVDWATILVPVLIGVVIVALVAWQIMGMVRRKHAGAALLASRPDVGRVYTRLGTSMGGAFKDAIGATASLNVSAVDNAQCGFVVDGSGGFTPVLPGHHTLKLFATVEYPGVAKRIITGEVGVALAPFQCVFVGYDKGQKTFVVQDLGYFGQSGATA
jgi:hypothetical protein